MLDYLIKDGTIVDGTGSPGYKGDIGVKDGRITAIGEVKQTAKETIDASGKIVSPGFVDCHTHYDAQVFWDPAISPSSYHGVTSVFAGNCGFSIAPLAPEAGDYLMRLLAKVEGMPLKSLQEGVPWDWTSFGSYLECLDNKMAINIGFLVGHSALRRVVMGEDSDQEATPAQIEAMKELLSKSLAVGPFDDKHKQLMTDMSLAAQRSLNWNVLIVNRGSKEIYQQQLTACDYAAERGAEVKALTFAQPVTLRLNLWSGFGMDSLPGWAPILALPMDERKKAFSDPATRERLIEGAASPDIPVMLRAMGNFARMTIEETFSPENAAYEGRTVAEVAAELNISPGEAFFDIAVADDLKTTFLPNLGGHDDESWQLRGEVWKDPRTLVGASDAGAHLDMIDTFAFSTTLLSEGVRQRQLLTLEEAIYEITEKPARFLGLRERGRLSTGWFADITIFDEASIGKGSIHTRYDLPGDAGRLYCEAEGISHVMVNGEVIVQNNGLTGKRPGIVMRSGRDTETVPIPAALTV